MEGYFNTLGHFSLLGIVTYFIWHFYGKILRRPRVKIINLEGCKPTKEGKYEFKKLV